MTSKRLVSVRCAICSAELHGKEFKHEELFEDGKIRSGSITGWFMANVRRRIGIGCTACGSYFCHPAHKKRLGFKLRSAYEKATCPECGALLAELDSVYDPKVETPAELLLSGERAAPKPRGLKEKLNLLSMKETLKRGEWRDNEEQRRRLLRQADSMQDVLMFAILESERAEAFLLLGALGQLGAEWAFGEDYFGDALIEDMIGRTKHSTSRWRDPGDEQLKAAAALALTELERRRRKGVYVPHILSVCRELGKYIPPDDTLTMVITRLDALTHIPEVADYLCETAEGDWITSYHDGTGLTSFRTVRLVGWYAARSLLCARASDRLKDLVPLWLGQVGQQDWGVRNHWLRTLLIDSVPQECLPVDQLVAALEHPEARARAMAASLLAGVNEVRVTDGLVKALGDSDDSVVQSAARALAKVGDPRAEEALQTLGKHPSRKVRREAKRALKNL